ncbi:MAG: 2,3-bisphosphoglycerate-independent phosphoglycerate mutase [Candidatus Berkelbacteria bacterium]|nr:2,3-bisphosphoglycerate-independent phosphoglycerate mutase [Candidatus Berkelbacteria bacterium]
MASEKVALIILDGFGIAKEKKGNAVFLAKTPYIDELFETYPKTLLKASAEEVGLPWGEFGNSEVGHSSLGLGRVVLQDLPQIDKAIADSTIPQKQAVLDAVKILNDKKSNINLIGIASDGGVHGHINHMIQMAKIFNQLCPSNKIILHLIADGRDVQEKSIERYLGQIEKELKNIAVIGSIMGRYFAMDRDKNWDRISSAYDAILGKKPTEGSPKDIVARSYTDNKTDEFIEPVSLNGDLNISLENDVFLFLNYRSDRAIQLTRAFVDQGLKDVKRDKIASNFLTMTTYDDNLGVKVLFSNIDLNDPEINPLLNSLSQIISKQGKKQFHVAETEKFAHVTYFFAGGVKGELDGQVNKLINSEKVKSYDLFPQMRAKEISDAIIEAVKENYDFIVANYANGDMVGHSGNLDATIKTVEIIDQSLSQIVPVLLESEYEIFIVADHGNCDEMIDLKSGKPSKEHSLNPVPFMCISEQTKGKFKSKVETANMEPVGLLADVAPTICDSLGVQTAPEMTGVNLKESLS